jgi:hypothetical protein
MWWDEITTQRLRMQCEREKMDNLLFDLSVLDAGSPSSQMVRRSPDRENGRIVPDPWPKSSVGLTSEFIPLYGLTEPLRISCNEQRLERTTYISEPARGAEKIYIEHSPGSVYHSSALFENFYREWL